jgi:hypothetical protein
MDTMQKLQKPFNLEELEFRIGATTKDKSKCIPLVYVTNRAIQNRLDDVFGPFGWKNEYREWKGGQLCGISIKHESEWITKWDGADCTQIESLKGGLSDSMKRCATQWGIGRYLYNSENIWVPMINGKMSLSLGDKLKILKGTYTTTTEEVPAVKTQTPVILETTVKSKQSSSSDITGMTEKQRKCIFGFLTKKACTKDDLDEYIIYKYKKPLSELSTTEASQVITFVKDLLEQSEIDKLTKIALDKGFKTEHVLKASKKNKLIYLTGDDYQILVNRVSKAPAIK